MKLDIEDAFIIFFYSVAAQNIDSVKVAAAKEKTKQEERMLRDRLKADTHKILRLQVANEDTIIQE